jgi:hypothetical protein
MGFWMKGEMPLMFQLNNLRDSDRSRWDLVGVCARRCRFKGGGDISRFMLLACLQMVP